MSWQAPHQTPTEQEASWLHLCLEIHGLFCGCRYPRDHLQSISRRVARGAQISEALSGPAAAPAWPSSTADAGAGGAGAGDDPVPGGGDAADGWDPAELEQLFEEVAEDAER